jgi:hypothetical protein
MVISSLRYLPRSAAAVRGSSFGRRILGPLNTSFAGRLAKVVVLTAINNLRFQIPDQLDRFSKKNFVRQMLSADSVSLRSFLS